MKKNLNVLIPDAESGHSLVVARCLGQIPGLCMHVMAENPWSALRFSRRRKYYHRGSLEKYKDFFLNSIAKIVQKTGADVLLPIDEPAVHIVSQHLTLLKDIVPVVPVPTVKTFNTATDKWQLAKYLVEQQIPCPHTILLNSSRPLSQNFESLTFPALIKPSRGHGGHGIELFDRPDQLVDFLKKSKSDSKTKYILQRYIDGYDIDCSLLAKEGKILAHTIQKGFIPRSQKYAAPAGVCFLQEDGVLDVVKRAVSALAFSGIAHIDLRYDRQAENFKIVEINARYWGSLTASLLAGVNFPYLACLAGLSIPFETPPYRLNRFIDHTTAAKEFGKRCLGKKSEKFRFAETDFSFILSDPLAELANIFIRWANP